VAKLMKVEESPAFIVWIAVPAHAQPEYHCSVPLWISPWLPKSSLPQHLAFRTVRGVLGGSVGTGSCFFGTFIAYLAVPQSRSISPVAYLVWES
jgi:hypothetical protein